MPPFSLKTAGAAALTWGVLGWWIADDFVDDSFGGPRLANACMVLGGSGAVAHAALLSSDRFRALRGKTAVVAVWLATLLVFAVVRAARRSGGSVLYEIALAAVPALAAAALACYVTRKLER